jgi:hypothetical protein
MASIERVKDRAVQFRGEVEQAVGKAREAMTELSLTSMVAAVVGAVVVLALVAAWSRARAVRRHNAGREA